VTRLVLRGNVAGVVFSDVGVAIGVGSVLFCASGVEVEVRGAFDGVCDGFGGGIDATAAYEGWKGEDSRGEEDDEGHGVVFAGGGGGGGMTAAAHSNRCS